jgi:hypothetical protein
MGNSTSRQRGDPGLGLKLGKNGKGWSISPLSCQGPAADICDVPDKEKTMTIVLTGW